MSWKQSVHKNLPYSLDIIENMYMGWIFLCCPVSVYNLWAIYCSCWLKNVCRLQMEIYILTILMVGCSTHFFGIICRLYTLITQYLEFCVSVFEHNVQWKNTITRFYACSPSNSYSREFSVPIIMEEGWDNVYQFMGHQTDTLQSFYHWHFSLHPPHNYILLKRNRAGNRILDCPNLEVSYII